MHLPQIGGKLGPLVAFAGYIWLHLATSGYIWLHLATSGYIWLHLATSGCGITTSRQVFNIPLSATVRNLDQRSDCFPLLAPHLLVKPNPQQIDLHACYLISLLPGGNSNQQSNCWVKRPVGIIGREGLLVCPLVAPLAEITDQAAFGRSQSLPKHLISLLPHDLQER